MKEPIQLFCLPYAGGSAQVIYHSWQKKLPPTIQVIPLELAGRGRRMEETYYLDMEEAVRDVESMLLDTWSGQRFALFGYSMGSIIAYELCNRLKEKGLPLPELVCISACTPPQHRTRKRKLHQLQDQVFLTEVSKLGGTPKELFTDAYYREIFLPIIKADYRLIENYQYTPREPLPCDFAVFNGRKDKEVEAIQEWDVHTSRSCHVYHFDGGHFFVHEHTTELLNVVLDIIGSKYERSGAHEFNKN